MQRIWGDLPYMHQRLLPQRTFDEIRVGGIDRSEDGRAFARANGNSYDTRRLPKYFTCICGNIGM